MHRRDQLTRHDSIVTLARAKVIKSAATVMFSEVTA